jgi:hypothetical protein
MIRVALEKKFKGSVVVVIGPRSRPVDKVWRRPMGEWGKVQTASNQRVKVCQGQDSKDGNGNMSLIHLEKVAARVDPVVDYLGPGLLGSTQCLITWVQGCR